VNNSGDLSVIVILREVVSWKVLFERKTRENILGASCWSIVDVNAKVRLGGKWTRKIS
jgi:hypothetical protein